MPKGMQRIGRCVRGGMDLYRRPGHRSHHSTGDHTENKQSESTRDTQNPTVGRRDRKP